MMEWYNNAFTQNADLWSWTVNVSAVKVLKATDCVSLGMCQTAYFELKRISSIRRFLTEDVSKTLVTSYILSRLDYCNCLLMAHPILSSNLSTKFKTFLQDSSSWHLIITTYLTPLLKKLHWVPISECIKYKVACTCFFAINGSGPTYLS